MNDLKDDNFFLAGVNAGYNDLVFLSVDPIRLEMAPAMFIDGWAYEFSFDTQGFNVYYIRECYVPNEDLTNALYDGMEAYMKGDTQTGDAKIAVTKELYPAALAKCTDTKEIDFNAKISEIEKKFDDLKARSDWNEISKKIYEENKAEIDEKLKNEFFYWKYG